MASGTLTARRVETIKEPGRHSDGNGLLLVVRPSGAKSWLLRATIRGKRADLGLGVYPAVGLKDARQMAEDMRREIASGIDPREARKATREAQKAAREPQRIMTWGDACAAFHKLNAGTWKNRKHSAQVLTTLRTYTPLMWDKPVAEVDQKMVFEALSQIWLTKPETARRVAQRIGGVLKWAKANGHFPGSPLDLIASAKAGLPKQKDKAQHHAMIAPEDVSRFVEDLRASGAAPTTALALEFLILTAARSGEVRGAVWSEIDTEARLWVIPAARMKMDREHRVPLCDRALEILELARPHAREDGLVFPGQREGRPISENSFVKLMKDRGWQATAHGFRASFRTWAATQPGVSRTVAERALAHMVENRVEASYQRDDHLEARRKLMDTWARYALPGEVVAFPIEGATVTPQ